MTPDQYRREGFQAGIEAAAHQVKSMRATDGVLHKQTQNLIVTALNIAAIRAIRGDEELAGMSPPADAVAHLVEAAQALVDHEALQDREYLSAHLNEKLDAARAALAEMETSHD